MTARRWRPVAWVLVAAGIGLVAYAAYIPAKAWLAQWLLDAAWDRRIAASGSPRPWPWADLAPMARLRQPRLGINQVVLDDASARSLAFGPAHVRGSARPGTHGNVVLSAHRDTHFRWLAALRDGDELLLEDAEGGVRGYRVVEREIRDQSDSTLLDPLAGDQLRLVTCYPFDAVRPGTPLRFVVTALPLPSASAAPRPRRNGFARADVVL